MPSDLALPMTERATRSSPSALSASSMHLTLAISYTCLRETSPTMSEPAAPDPFSIFAAFFSRYDTGGVLNVKENVRSGLIVINVGIGTSGLK